MNCSILHNSSQQELLYADVEVFDLKMFEFSKVFTLLNSNITDSWLTHCKNRSTIIVKCLSTDESRGTVISRHHSFYLTPLLKNDSQTLYCVNSVCVCAHVGKLECLEVVMLWQVSVFWFAKPLCVFNFEKLFGCSSAVTACCRDLKPLQTDVQLEERHAAVFLVWIIT